MPLLWGVGARWRELAAWSSLRRRAGGLSGGAGAALRRAKCPGEERPRAGGSAHPPPPFVPLLSVTALTGETRLQSGASGLQQVVKTRRSPGACLPAPGTLTLQSRRLCSQASDSSPRPRLRTKLLVSCLLGGALMGLWFLVHLEKERRRRERRLQQLQELALGRGDFNLLDQTGRPRTKSDFFGHWALLYFGFTHCPDICPDELDKMSSVVQMLDKDRTLPPVQPIFITVDAERDGVQEMARYIKDFHPRMIGLTGTPEQIEELGKAYRVYYSAGPKDQDNDYIVDHTIIIYLLNPDGLFTDYYNRSKNDQEIAESIRNHMKTYIKLFS
ncbi:protein SCO2 homolog, mitochondrial [Heptranchias perlo]|uniref:protein SCO2 homolog, mitochondrial n=1 Tax=Heptranchias perlo TaxID=212740 RepID=UPI0035594AF5